MTLRKRRETYGAYGAVDAAPAQREDSLSEPPHMRGVIRVWFGRMGVDVGRPWLVQRRDGSCDRVADVTLCGCWEGRYAPDGEPSLPESPKCYLERKLDEQW